MNEVKTKSTIGLMICNCDMHSWNDWRGYIFHFRSGIQISGNFIYISIAGGIIALLNAYSYAKLSIHYPSEGLYYAI